MHGTEVRALRKHEHRGAAAVASRALVDSPTSVAIYGDDTIDALAGLYGDLGSFFASLPERLSMAEAFGAEPLHLVEQDVRAAVRGATEGRGVDVSIDAVGDPKVLESAIRLTRNCGAIQCIGVYAERAEVHMGLLWLKALTLRGGHANVIGHVDRVLALLSAGVLDPTALVTRHMKLEDAPEAYAVYDRREALKIVLTP